MSKPASDSPKQKGRFGALLESPSGYILLLMVVLTGIVAAALLITNVNPPTILYKEF